MIKLIIIAFYLVLPAYFANMAPVIFAKLAWLKSLNKPIDAGIKLGKEQLFGQNKTWRGLVAGVIGGLIATFIQLLLSSNQFFASISIVDYGQYWIIFGCLAGLGAILGDLAKSFFKRRVGIKSGGVWPVFDQLDFIAGFFLFTYWIIYPGWQIILTVAVLTLLLHPLSNIIGYLIGFKKVWW